MYFTIQVMMYSNDNVAHVSILVRIGCWCDTGRSRSPALMSMMVQMCCMCAESDCARAVLHVANAAHVMSRACISVGASLWLLCSQCLCDAHSLPAWPNPRMMRFVCLLVRCRVRALPARRPAQRRTLVRLGPRLRLLSWTLTRSCGTRCSSPDCRTRRPLSPPGSRRQGSGSELMVLELDAQPAAVWKRT